MPAASVMLGPARVRGRTNLNRCSFRIFILRSSFESLAPHFRRQNWTGKLHFLPEALYSDPLNARSADTQAAFAGAVNVAAFILTNSCTFNGPYPVSVRTSCDIRSSEAWG